MASFKFQKTVLAVSATAAVAGLLVGGQAFAQVNTEQGSIDVGAKLITATCVLNLDSTASTTATAAKKTLDLGTFSLANVSSLGATFPVGKGISVVLSLKESNGTAGCAAISTGKWDVQIDMPATAYNTSNLDNSHTFTNTTTGATAATGVAARLTKSINGGAVSVVLPGDRIPVYGYLLSGSTTPNFASTDTVTVTAELWRLRAGNALAAGTYTASIPLTVVYK